MPKAFMHLHKSVSPTGNKYLLMILINLNLDYLSEFLTALTVTYCYLLLREAMRCSLKPTRNADFSTESIGAAMRKWATYMESARESVAPTRSETNQYFESARIRANR